MQAAGPHPGFKATKPTPSFELQKATQSWLKDESVTILSELLQ